jgi:hypothetical protein
MPCPYPCALCLPYAFASAMIAPLLVTLFSNPRRPAGRPYVLFALFAARLLPYFFSSLGKPYAAVIFSIYTFCLAM